MAQTNDSKFYNGQIVEAYSIEHRYNEPNAFELRFVVGIFNDDGSPKAKVDCFLEVSMRYGTGNNAQRTQWDMTKETLAHLGFQGDDISNAQLAAQLTNKPCRVREQLLDKNGKPFSTPRYYFTTQKPMKTIDDANARLKHIMSGVSFGGAAAAPAANPFNMPAAAPAPAAPAGNATPNPFAGM